MFALILFKTFAPCELFFNYALLSLEGKYGIFYKFFLILWRRAINSIALIFLKYICQQYDFFFLVSLFGLLEQNTLDLVA